MRNRGASAGGLHCGEGLNTRPKNRVLDVYERSLPSVPRDRPVSLMLRHAHRSAIPHGILGDDVELTDRGRSEAKELGDMLQGFCLGTMASNAIGRCIETAQMISIGHGDASTEVSIEMRLANFGVFVRDRHLAEPQLLNLGAQEWVRRQLLEPSSLQGMLETSVGVDSLIDLLHPVGPPGLNLYVTHDVVVAALVGFLCGRGFHPNDWPSYLEGVFLWGGEEGFTIMWRDAQYTVDPSLSAPRPDPEPKESLPRTAVHRSRCDTHTIQEA